MYRKPSSQGKQFAALQLQNLATVWRKHSLNNLMAEQEGMLFGGLQDSRSKGFSLGCVATEMFAATVKVEPPAKTTLLLLALQRC